MVLSVITLAAVTPLLATSTIQLQETVQKQPSQQNGIDETLKTEKCHLRVKASARMSETRKEIVKDRIVVLRNDKVEYSRVVTAFAHRALVECNADEFGSSSWKRLSVDQTTLSLAISCPILGKTSTVLYRPSTK